ncbi:translation initiation factor IF-2 [Planctomycetota bacterium]|nr:translation initiation factor IF-2 [Planctomycetota bacterium]
MAVDSTTTVQALKIYKEIGMSLKDFKAKCAEIGITVKGAVSKLSIDDAEKIRVHLGIAEEAKPEAAPKKTPKKTAEKSTEKAPDEATQPELAKVEKTKGELAAEAAEKQRAAEVKEMEQAQKKLADALGVTADQVDFVSQTLGVAINNVEDITETVAKRAEKLHSVIRIAKEFDTSPREISITAQNLGIRVGGKNFKGLSKNEEFMLNAMVKQKFKSKEERLKEVEVHDDKEHKPAAPTGNKAVEAREQTQRQTKQKGRTSHEQTREVIPDRFAAQGGGAGRGRGGGAAGAGRHGRERFDVKNVGHDRRGGGRRRGGRRRGDEEQQKKEVELPTGPVTVEQPLNLRQLSEAMGTKTSEIQKRMLTEGLPMMRINDSLSKDIIEQIGIIFDREITVTEPKGADDLIQEQLKSFDEAAGQEVSRAPIVTVMGHVDHGKTSLLDAIARLDRVSGESGGITQHIGAFRLDLLEKDEKFLPHKTGEEVPEDAKRLEVTFIDTPGHEAFTAMRARGANVTDIAVIVVAADDGIMPQTEEAISHARSAEVEIVIAVTKIDKPEANLAKVRQQLAGKNLMSPEWGGTTEIIELSSITGEGVDKLIRVLSDYSDLLEITAVAEKPAVGTVLEANRDVGRGIVATMLVKEGTLHRGDVIVAGHGYGRVRAMQESRGDGLHVIDRAGPSIPVEVAGLDELPEAGSLFHGMKDLKKAAEIANMVRMQEEELARSRGFSLEEWSKARAGQAVKELVIVLKGDYQGSVETIVQELEKLKHDEVRIKVIHNAVGGITTTDVHLAEAAHGIVIGFHVGVDAKARELADNHHVDIRTYEVIYKLIEEIRGALEGLLEPELVEKYQGTAEVRKVFRVSKVGKIAGCMVTKGIIKRDSKLRLVREGVPIYESRVGSLKREKDDASDVREGFECGIQLQKFDDLKEGDLIEAYEVEEHSRTLED